MNVKLGTQFKWEGEVYTVVDDAPQSYGMMCTCVRYGYVRYFDPRIINACRIDRSNQ